MHASPAPLGVSAPGPQSSVRPPRGPSHAFPLIPYLIAAQLPHFSQFKPLTHDTMKRHDTKHLGRCVSSQLRCSSACYPEGRAAVVGLPIQTRSPQPPRYYDPAYFRDHQQRGGTPQHRPASLQRHMVAPAVWANTSLCTLSLCVESAPPADIQILHLFIQDGITYTVRKNIRRVLLPGYLEDNTSHTPGPTAA